MKHLGDITKISGYTAPIVDCIIGGSPCQDLSMAGKRAGLDGERSGLFMEQVRIVKEMRKQDELNGRSGVDIRPRYMVWENVPGAFSSNKAEDFRIVLEELAKVKDENAVIPMPPNGKWTNSGCVMGDGWSIAWRVLDAQFWGVPQRRRRIALVADFGGSSAPEILFVRKSMSGHTDESEPKRKEAPTDASRGIGADDREGAICYGISSYDSNAMKSSNPHSGIYVADTSRTLDLNGGNPNCNQGGIAIVEAVPYTLKIRSGCEGGGKGALVQEDKEGKVQTLSGRMGTGGGNVPLVLALDRASYNQGKNAQYDFEISGKGINSPLVAKGLGAVCYSVDQGGGKSACNVTEGQAPTLTCTHGGEPAVCYSLQGGGATSQNSQGIGYTEDKSYTLNTIDRYAVCYEPITIHREMVAGTLMARDSQGPGRWDTLNKVICQAVDCRNGSENDVNGNLQSNSAHSLNGNNVVRTRYIVRRLTPLECERLQGYPDGWTDIGEWTDTNGKKKQTSDAARYKALGNSIALPPWKWVLKRLCACYERDATMASLFDGIGGFPYLWEQLNGKGSCLWASEIEEFPIAVTKARIGD